MSRRVLLCVYRFPDRSRRQIAPGYEPDFAEVLDARTAHALEQISPSATRLQLVHAAFGLQAGWLAVAVEIIDAAEAIEAAGAFAAQATSRAKRLYTTVTEAVGHKPLVSRGAAEWLAAADLNDRQPNGPCRRYASGDATPATPGPSRRDEAFFVVLSTRRELHHYFVSVYGDISHMGPSPLSEHETDAPPSHWAGGDTDRN